MIFVELEGSVCVWCIDYYCMCCDVGSALVVLCSVNIEGRFNELMLNL